MRVFKDVILSNLIEPCFKRRDLDEMRYDELKNYAEEIFNVSIKNLSKNYQENYQINLALKEYENKIFNLSNEAQELLNNKINYFSAINLINKKNEPKNLVWLKYLISDKNVRKNKSTRFPIEAVVISEGITEEILLPVFAEHAGLDFDKSGIQVISAGGKNQVVKLFYKLSEQLKLPIYILLDNDAKSNYEQIIPKMRNFDKIHLLKGGEFEDILPKELIIKTLNDHFKNLNYIEDNEFEDERMVKNLEEIFKKKGFHEFKKAEFAQLIKSHIISKEDISDEILSIVSELRELI